MDFSTSEITPKKVRGSNIDFSTTEIALKKVRGNEVDFSISEITSKTSLKMTWKFVENWSWTYRLNIDVESTWIRRGVPVGLLYLSRSERSSNGERYFYSRSRRSECSGTEMKIYVFCRGHGVLSVAAKEKNFFGYIHVVVYVVPMGKDIFIHDIGVVNVVVLKWRYIFFVMVMA